jgi:hypothetical protein
LLLGACLTDEPQYGREGARGKAENDVVLTVGGKHGFSREVEIDVKRQRPREVELGEIRCADDGGCEAEVYLEVSVDALEADLDDDEERSLRWCLDGECNALSFDGEGVVLHATNRWLTVGGERAELTVSVNFAGSDLEGVSVLVVRWEGWWRPATDSTEHSRRATEGNEADDSEEGEYPLVSPGHFCVSLGKQCPLAGAICNPVGCTCVCRDSDGAAVKKRFEPGDPTTCEEEGDQCPGREACEARCADYGEENDLEDCEIHTPFWKAACRFDETERNPPDDGYPWVDPSLYCVDPGKKCPFPGAICEAVSCTCLCRDPLDGSMAPKGLKAGESTRCQERGDLCPGCRSRCDEYGDENALDCAQSGSSGWDNSCA